MGTGMTWTQIIGRIRAIQRSELAESLELIAIETEPDILSQAIDVLTGERERAARKRLVELWAESRLAAERA